MASSARSTDSTAPTTSSGPTTSTAPTVSTRDRILAAAEDVVVTDGVACLTLEKAAARAGLSKGGVLYHFPSRTALVSAMVARLADSFDASVNSYAQADPTPGGFARAYVHETFAAPAGELEEHGERVGSAILAAMASEPQLLEPLRTAFAGWQHRIEADSPEPVTATVARLAADGLWLLELFGLDALTPQLREQVRLELLAMVS